MQAALLAGELQAEVSFFIFEKSGGGLGLCPHSVKK
jgi:hypothetical protein